MSVLTLGIPSKGRLMEAANERLAKAGLRNHPPRIGARLSWPAEGRERR